MLHAWMRKRTCRIDGDDPRMRPVRAMPVCTSSAMSRMPCWSQRARSWRRNDAGAGLKPPSPWIASIRMAATDDGGISCPRSVCSAAIAPVHVVARGFSAPEVYEIDESEVVREQDRIGGLGDGLFIGIIGVILLAHKTPLVGC